MSKPIFSKDRSALPKESHYVDAFEPQLKELFFIENKQFIGTSKLEAYKGTEFAAFADKMKDAFTYVHFPWNGHTIKTVEKDKYLSLKTNRNQDLITKEEQGILSDYHVAVLGLSVGSNIAIVLTQAGISNDIVLADFDELDTTNLNRILAGVHQIGMNKCDVAAEHIYQDNPFANVTTLPEGVSEENLEKLLSEGKIDCIIEEIDDMPMKIVTRKLAIEYKVPVVMITDNGDGVVLHIERYDLGHEMIFGHDMAYWDKVLSEGEMTKEMAGKIIIGDIVGGPQFVDPKMMKSVVRVLKKELVSWSQLGSSAILGGVVATAAIKDIVIGGSKEKDVRIYVHPLNTRYGE